MKRGKKRENVKKGMRKINKKQGDKRMKEQEVKEVDKRRQGE